MGKQSDIPGVPPLTAEMAAQRRLPGWHPKAPALVVSEARYKGPATGYKLIAALSAMLAAHKLRPATLTVLATMIWRYRPGLVYRQRLSALAEDAAGGAGRERAFGERTMYRALSELCAAGIVVRVEGGWAIRLIEDHLPKGQRVNWQEPPEQVSFRLPLTRPMADWLREKRGAA